jgi:Flp pilus assembly protein CpaB
VKRSNRLVILVGVLLAVLAFVAIVILLNQREEAVAPEEITETVLIATQDIAIGDSVTPDVVEEQEIDPEAVQGTALTSSTAVSGQPALFPIPAGSQVTAEAIGIGTDRLPAISSQLEPGEKAIAFQVDRATGLDFLIQPGDVIDVVAAVQVLPQLVPATESLRTVKTVLQDKRVLYVSVNRAVQPEPVDADGDGQPDPEQPQQEPVDGAIVVFAGTDQDAEIIRFAQRTGTDVGDSVSGSLSAVLRHTDDDDVEETTGITIDQLVDEYGLLVPDVADLLPELPPSEEPAP